MLEFERHKLILKLLSERSVVSVADLVDLLSASEATIRRDINALAEQGAVRRLRGGVEAINARYRPQLVGMPFSLSQEINIPQKRAIARAAASLIGSGESIIINGGTTTFALVEFLVDMDLDILTNSFPIAAQLIATSRNRITIPGGTIYREQCMVLTPFQNDTSENFWAKRLFTGCYGINRFGIMENDPLFVHAEHKLLLRAEQLVVMADSSKLRRQSSMVVANIDRISTFITDDGATSEEIEYFRAAGVNVVLAEVTDDDRQLTPVRSAV